jgi:ubiquinone/menaquinone biosynthesis C-methylase UbiE
MNDALPDSSQLAESWDAYWTGTGEIGAYSSGGISHPATQGFWDETFQAVKRDFGLPSIIDIASGNGVVVECALDHFASGKVDITCIDLSATAVAKIRKRFPSVHGLVSDARSIPLESGSIDIATSQFGIEYGGQEAVDEAARLLAPGGRLVLMMHKKESIIHNACSINLQAMSEFQESQFIPYAIEMFTAGFEAVGGSDRAPYDQAASRFAPAVNTAEAIMNKYGQQAAGEVIARIYGDVGRMHGKIQYYEPAEVLDWLNRMNEELKSYAKRMFSMTQVAIDDESFERMCAGLRHRGYAINRAEPLNTPIDDHPLAWVLVASR